MVRHTECVCKSCRRKHYVPHLIASVLITAGIFLETLENVDSVLIPDNSILMIVSEEIPPYFVEQKDIDSVISVINSRTQVVFDER